MPAAIQMSLAIVLEFLDSLGVDINFAFQAKYWVGIGEAGTVFCVWTSPTSPIHDPSACACIRSLCSRKAQEAHAHALYADL
jgi:hypothetical protein